jgi:hypothetical protein
MLSYSCSAFSVSCLFYSCAAISIFSYFCAAISDFNLYYSCAAVSASSLSFPALTYELVDLGELLDY